MLGTEDGALRGLIPTAWYPNQLALTPDGRQLAVATLLGVGSGAELKDPARRYVHAYRGTVHVVPVPDAAQLASYTTAVAENNHVRHGAARSSQPATARTAAPAAVPRRAGDPSLIEHVVYIIKENRTYDQLFGDLPKGNGDPSLVHVRRGRHAEPSQAGRPSSSCSTTSTRPAATAATATVGDAGERDRATALWPGYVGRSYPFDGTDPIAYANTRLPLGPARCARQDRAGLRRVRRPAAGDRSRRSARGCSSAGRRGDDFTSDWYITRAARAAQQDAGARTIRPTRRPIPDVVRAQIFLEGSEEVGGRRHDAEPGDPAAAERSHARHRARTSHTPKAMVADNDLALGQIVEALSQSPFWKKMAIFVVEDDAQNGVDHVDGHRTVALAISPYVRRGTSTRRSTRTRAWSRRSS